MLLEEMGNRIKDYRTRLGFTQNDLASALTVSPQAVSKWERGENAPDIAILPALSEILGVSIDTLLGANYREKRTFEATVVFADMEDFSSLSRGTAPSDLAIALNAFYYPLTEHMVALDGLPIKYIGDELLCLFAGENHRRRAFRAIFAAKAASPRPVRFSVSSGQVWMGSLGHPLYARPDVLGDPVSLASYLQGWAKIKAASRVAASSPAVDPVKESLRIGECESLALPAPSEAVMVYEILGLAP